MPTPIKDHVSRYVLGFIFNSNLTLVALIRKSKPTWQAGLLNGIGGKIEPGEAADAAMLREGIEETGHSFTWTRFAVEDGVLFGPYELHCYFARHPAPDRWTGVADEFPKFTALPDEPLEIVSLQDIPVRSSISEEKNFVDDVPFYLSCALKWIMRKRNASSPSNPFYLRFTQPR